MRNGLRVPIVIPRSRKVVRLCVPVAIELGDITRPMPNERVLPVLAEWSRRLPEGYIAFINPVGTRGPNEHDRLEHLLGRTLPSAVW